MSFLKSNNCRNVVTGILIALAALYLTFIVDVYTLNTLPKRVFVFAYFVVMCSLAYWLKRKFLGEAKLRQVVASAVLAAAVLIVLQNIFLPLAREQQITLCANRLEDAPVGEVWLVGAEIDGEYYEASVLDADMDGWIYNADYDDYVYYPGEENIENSLTFEVTAAEVELQFGSNPWSGCVGVEKETGTELVNLYSETEQDGGLLYEIEQMTEYSLAERAALNAGAAIVIGFLLYCIL